MARQFSPKQSLGSMQSQLKLQLISFPELDKLILKFIEKCKGKNIQDNLKDRNGKIRFTIRLQ